MTRAFMALTAEPWAIESSWLRFLAELAARQPVDGPPAEATWAAHNLDLLAGPGGQRLEGARSAVVTGEGVALISAFGPIFPRANMMTDVSGCTTAQAIQADLAVAGASDQVGAIMLLIDSPGGPVAQIAELSDAIYASRKVKPISAHVMGSMASAAFWFGSQAQTVTADRTAMVGSVGVVVGLSKQVEADGAGNMSFEIVSSNAPDKRIDPENDDQRAGLVATLDAIETQMVNDLARGRGTTPTRVKSDFGRGGVLVGKAAMEAGMVDQICSFDAAYRAVAKSVANQRRVAALRA